jgi:hypothetical protein
MITLFLLILIQLWISYQLVCMCAPFMVTLPYIVKLCYTCVCNWHISNSLSHDDLCMQIAHVTITLTAACFATQFQLACITYVTNAVVSFTFISNVVSSCCGRSTLYSVRIKRSCWPAYDKILTYAFLHLIQLMTVIAY